MLAPIESINQALVRLGKKKLHVLSHTASNFLDHFHRLNRLRITIGTKDIDMQDLRKQISNARNLLNKLNTNGIDGDSALGVIAGCGGLGASSFTAGVVLGGGLAASGLRMTVLGGLVAGPALAILGAVRADDMEEKLEKAKAYYSQVEAAVKKADVMIDNIQAVRKVVDLFTEQITKLDALFFSLSQGTIATMKKHDYDYDSYNQREIDQLGVTVSTLMTLKAFLKVSIMDKQHQKLTEKAKNALILMRDQMDSLENGNYSLRGIGFRQAQLEDLRDDKTS
ncbi:sortase [Helicobacter pylori]|nr:sortase [Helicobacter pylori]